MKFNKLQRQGHELASRLSQGYEYSGDTVLELSNAEFAALYKEICTGGVKAPSQVVAILDQTKFRRNLGKDEAADGNEHDALVMRAAAAFRENLDSLPMEVLRKCPDSQIKKSFVRVVLGKGEGNLADYGMCHTWGDCVAHMLDIASTDLSESFLKRARAAGRTEGEDSSEEEEWSLQKGKKKNGNYKEDAMKKSTDREPETRAENPQEDIRQWKAEFLRLRGKVKHQPSDLDECGTYWKKVKKLRWLEEQQGHAQEDSRRGGGAAAVPSPQSNWRGGGRGQYGDQRQGGGYVQNPQAREWKRPEDTQRSNSPFRGEGNYRSNSPFRGEGGPAPGQRGSQTSGGRQWGVEPQLQSRAQVPPPNGVQCYNCQEYGHVAKDCKQPHRQRGQSPRPGEDRFATGGGAPPMPPK